MSTPLSASINDDSSDSDDSSAPDGAPARAPSALLSDVDHLITPLLRLDPPESSEMESHTTSKAAGHGVQIWSGVLQDTGCSTAAASGLSHSVHRSDLQHCIGRCERLQPLDQPTHSRSSQIGWGCQLFKPGSWLSSSHQH